MGELSSIFKEFKFIVSGKKRRGEIEAALDGILDPEVLCDDISVIKVVKDAGDVSTEVLESIAEEISESSENVKNSFILVSFVLLRKEVLENRNALIQLGCENILIENTVDEYKVHYVHVKVTFLQDSLNIRGYILNIAPRFE
jgi:hypothetical protein